jgi:hypothetical protein
MSSTDMFEDGLNDDWPTNGTLPTDRATEDPFHASLSAEAGMYTYASVTISSGPATVQGTVLFVARGDPSQPPIRTLEIDAPPIRLARPPAGRLISTLRFILTEQAFERMIAPFVAQEQNAHYEALLRKDFRLARWIAFRMYLMIGYNVFCAATTSVTRLIRKSG